MKENIRWSVLGKKDPCNSEIMRFRMILKYYTRNKKVCTKGKSTVNTVSLIIITSITNTWPSCVLFGHHNPHTSPMTQEQ